MYFSPDEPGAFYAVLPLKGVYAFDPIPDVRLLVSNDSSMISTDSEPLTNSEEINKEKGSDADQREEVNVDEILEGIKQGRVPKDLSESEQTHILGGQANVWTEYIPNSKTCEYMLLPRICAFSEAVW